MSASGETMYTFRALGPDVLQWGRDNTVSLTIWRDGAQVVPASATIQVLDRAGAVAVATTAAAVAAGGTVSYVVLAAVLPTTDENILGQGWRLIWAVTFTGGGVVTVDRMVDVARFPLYCPITDQDLIALYPTLAAHKGDSPTSFQGFIDESWRQARAAFRAAGRLEYLVKNPEAIREALIHSTLGKAFRAWSMGAGQRGNYLALAEYHEGKAPASWKEAALAVDWDGDGVVDDLSERVSTSTMISFGGAPRGRRVSAWSY